MLLAFQRLAYNQGGTQPRFAAWNDRGYIPEPDRRTCWVGKGFPNSYSNVWSSPTSVQCAGTIEGVPTKLKHGFARLEVQLEIHFDQYPAAKFGDARFDVPFNGPHGRLKKALRSVRRRFDQIESAYFLICSDPAWGDSAEPIVAVAPRVSTLQLSSAWEPYIPDFGVVGFFHAVNNQFSAFASHAATPFYCPRETSKMPAPFSKPPSWPAKSLGSDVSKKQVAMSAIPRIISGGLEVERQH